MPPTSHDKPLPENPQRKSGRGGLRPSTRLPASANIKVGLLITSVAIVLGTIYYSHGLVDQLKTRELHVARLFADAVKYYNGNSEFPDDSLYRMVTSYTKRSGVPVIMTDQHNAPVVRQFALNNFNIPYDASLDSAAQYRLLQDQMREMDRVYKPIPITFTYPNGTQVVTQYIHYGNSPILSQIERLPLIEILLGAVIVFIGYLSFSYLKKSEQSNIWVGMAKETAHQLGTPLSSLLGWAELIKLSADQPDEVTKMAGEVERDIERLNRIAIRFSKIGSVPDLKPQNVVSIIADVMNYFEGRMPQLRRNIRLELECDEDEIMVPLNRELFEWVMENLVKNAFEAIEVPDGKITVHIARGPRQDGVIIDVSDTGKGIDAGKKRDVFRPGYSTKSRGWGLGLSLARRIIEEYHDGRIIVKESALNKGTTFRIRLHAVNS